jgi:23S rRNA pseudouridine1911/1915/1917 synthase
MEEEATKKRLDIVLSKKYPEYSRSLIQKLIKEGRVKVNGYCLKKPSIDVLQTADIKLDLTNLHKEKKEIDVKVIYEDSNLVVANKPSGILTHSKGAYNPETALADLLKLRKNYRFTEDNDRGGIVHRLDRATSGVIICAKNAETFTYLQKQFSSRETKKIYIAVIEGHLKNPQALIDIPINRNPKDPKMFRPDPNGKSAQTYYKVLNSNDKYSLVELKPITGRTHQLRVHLKHLGHPIVGDSFYGGKKADRLMLHALSLQINIPDNSIKTFTADMPQEFNKYVD